MNKYIHLSMDQEATEADVATALALPCIGIQMSGQLYFI